jgi:hypothetical protein
MWDRSRLATALLLCLPFSAARGQPPVPLGPEIVVSPSTTGSVDSCAVASDGSGNFVVVWGRFSDSPGYDDFRISGRRYDRTGLPLDGAFDVSPVYGGMVPPPVDVARSSGGDFVVVWLDAREDQYSSSRNTMARRYSSAGQALGDAFAVQTVHGGYPAAAMDADGNFVVVWDGGDGSGNYGVFQRRYDSAGLLQGEGFVASDTSTTYLRWPDAAARPEGDFVVTWSGMPSLYGPDPFISAQRFNSDGTPQGDEVSVSPSMRFQRLPAVSIGDAGFVVAWEDDVGYGESSDYIVLARRFGSDGQALDSSFQVNTYATGNQKSADVAIDPAGNFIVVWNSGDPTIGPTEIFARFYNSSGVAQGDDFQVNLSTGGVGDPSVASIGSSSFVVAWPGSAGVLARLFGAATPTSMPSPTATATPELTSTATETASPEPSATSTATATPELTSTATETASSEPSATSTATETASPEPSATSTATAAPHPSPRRRRTPHPWS